MGSLISEERIFTEIHEVLQRITPRDGESYAREWHRMAALVEAHATDAEGRGNWVSARNFFQRASTYYRTALFFLPNDDPRKVGWLEKTRDTFDAAAKYFAPPAEHITISYEGHKLPGYFFPPKQRSGRFPTVLFINGGDSLCSEDYFWCGSTFTEAGYGFMAFDQPGTGLTLVSGKLPSRPDSERFVSPAVDYLRGRPDADPDRIILAGISMGGYLVPRAAAFEKRIAAAIAWSAPYSLGETFRFYLFEHVRLDPGALSNMKALIGANSADPEDIIATADRYTLRGVLDKVECPLLVFQGAEDGLISSPMNQAYRTYMEAGSKVKKLVLIERDGGLGGVTHCQIDNLHLAHEVMLNWLNEVGLGVPRQLREAVAAART